MALCWPRLILLIWAFALYASANTISLDSDLTSIIPACAQDCFISFINSNFPTSVCSGTPSLDCLCSHNSTTGYTIGEGAVQCLISEDNIGFCQGENATDSVVINAYQMCNGQTSALPNTHATITATLVIETSMPSVVLVASMEGVSSDMSSIPITTTTPAQSSTSMPSMRLTTFATQTSSPSKTSSSSSAFATNTDKAATAGPSLTKSQVTAVAVGTAGGAAIVIGLLIFFICLRRRQQQLKRGSDMLPFQLDSKHPIEKTKYEYNFKRSPKRGRGPGGTPNGVAAKVHRIPPPIPLRLETSPPNMFARRSVRAIEAVTLVPSPTTPRSPERTPRRSSRLLPDKPTLSLQVPAEVYRPVGQQPRHDSATSRQSTVTTFEEDEMTATTPGESGIWSRRSTVKSVGEARVSTLRQINSQPKPPTFFIDYNDEEGAGWQPQIPQQAKSTKPAKEHQVKPLSLGRGASFSQPRRPAAFPTQPLNLKPTNQLQVPAPSPRIISTTSSLYSVRGSSIASSAPSPNFYKDNSTRGPCSYKAIGPYDNQVSNVSSTSIETDTSFEPGLPPPVRELSPVVESPMSGTSPVTYPKIPRRLSATAMFGPPPRQPDFSKSLAGISEQKEPAKPTTSGVDPVQVPPRSEKRIVNLPQAEIDVRRERRESRQLSKSQLMPLPSLGHQRQGSGQSIHSSQPTLQPPPVQKPQSPLPQKAPLPKASHPRFSFQLPPTPPSTASPRPVQPPKGAFTSNLFQTPTPTPSPPRHTPPPVRQAPAPMAPKQRLHLYTGIPSTNLHATSPSHDYPAPHSPTENHLSTLPSQKASKSYRPPQSESSHKPLTDATGGFSIFPSTSPYTQNPPLPFNLLTHSPLSPRQQPNLNLNLSLSPLQEQALENEDKYPLPSPQPPPPTRSSSKASTSSSLLAKRRGEMAAAALVLDSTKGRSTGKGKEIRTSPSKWRVLKPQDINEAKSSTWRPMASVSPSPRRAEFSPHLKSSRDRPEISTSSSNMGQADSNRYAQTRGQEGVGLGIRKREDSERVRNEVYMAGYTLEREELPATPGWKPHLTPTRRGSQLFLNVR